MGQCGMKLLDNFKQQLGGMGRLKRVWLTTFNLDIAFVESWVLPAVLGMDPPVSRMDYEGLQRALMDSGICVSPPDSFCSASITLATSRTACACEYACMSSGTSEGG